MQKELKLVDYDYDAKRKEIVKDQYGDIIQEILESQNAEFPIGTRVWAKLQSTECPAVIWHIDYCLPDQWPEIIQSYIKGKVFIQFYGDRNCMWTWPSRLQKLTKIFKIKHTKFEYWLKKSHYDYNVELAWQDLKKSNNNPQDEIARLRFSSFLNLNKMTILYDNCDLCLEEITELICHHCQRAYHSICLALPPPTTHPNFSYETHWDCPGCKKLNEIPESYQKTAYDVTAESTGLTPDWIINFAAYKVFQLPRLSPDIPYIEGLLDPCTDSKRNPNIPAEKLYDKTDDGLKLSNSWAGYYIILNPDYKSHIQWRFVNRAINEVENDNVPAVILISRNSTDSAYFQRLRPYPRVLLKRQSIKFKNYENTPIGFGIVLFCIVKHDQKELYQRFYDAFAEFGEMNTAIDKNVLKEPDFLSLLSRIKVTAERHERDHWVQCCQCLKWRLITYNAVIRAKTEKSWTCKNLRPPFTNCDTEQTKFEMMGIKYASGVANDFDPEVSSFSPTNQTTYQLKKANSSSSSHQYTFDKESKCKATREKIRPHVKQMVSLNDLEAHNVDNIFEETLHRLTNLPRRSNVSIESQMPQFSPNHPDTCTCNFLLNSLELARHARSAANRAFLKVIGRSPSDIHNGNIIPLSPKDPLVIQAAREIVKQSNLSESKYKQVQEAERKYETAKRRRQMEKARMTRELEQMIKMNSEAHEAMKIAQNAEIELEDLISYIHNIPM